MRISITIVILLLSVSIMAQTSHWEAIIKSSNTFSYFVSGGEPPIRWKDLNFDDSSWNQGTGGFGYGDNDDGTIISNTRSVYLRKTFQIEDSSMIQSLILDVDYDDGYVAYFNGKEVARSSNVTDENPAYNTTLSGGHEAGTPARTLLDASLVRKGLNVLSLHVINVSSTSSDMSSNLYLHAKISGEEILFSQPASYFIVPQELSESNLPIIRINTFGKSIEDDPKIMAYMQAVGRIDGGINYANGPFNVYEGWIGIEVRGESTQTRPKVSYRFETRNEDESNRNVSLFGLPSENDWILYGPYVDKSLMRNELAFHICNELGHYASRRQYCELIINNAYEGIYVLEEKIKVDDNRVDIAKLKPEDITGDELTGGYIFRSDKGTSDFSSGVNYEGNQAKWLQYYDPDKLELNNTQKSYLRNYITSFEQKLVSSGYQDPQTGYNNFINVSSFIDYLVASEIILEVDRFRFSTYFYKKKDSNGGKIYAGPMWDNNYGFGITDSYNYLLNDDVWTHQDTNDRIYWWRRLMEDSYFRNLFFTRWTQMRENSLSDESICNHIDSVASLVEEAQHRNFNRWPIMGIYVYPNRFVGQNYSEEIEYLKEYVKKRTAWIDQHISGERILPEISMQLSENYALQDNFDIKISLQNDYFNRNVFSNKHFKLHNEGVFFQKDTIICLDASHAVIKVTHRMPGITLPEDFFVSVSEKVINSFQDLYTPTLIAGKMDRHSEPQPTAYVHLGKAYLRCNSPEALGERIFIYDMTGNLVKSLITERTYINDLGQLPSYQFLLIKLVYKGNPMSIKLMQK